MKKKSPAKKEKKDVYALLTDMNIKMDSLIRGQRALERRVDYLKVELLFSLRDEVVNESELYPSFYIEA